MLELECISTGSNANCYLLRNNKETLIIDMGVKHNTLLLHIDDIYNVVGGILSHQHIDHNAMNGNIRTSEMLENIGLTILSPDNCELYKKYKLGNFEIIPTKNIHNIICYGYLIRIDNEIIYFATDTKELTKFRNLQIDHFIIECNYCDYMCKYAMLRDNTNLAHLQGIFDNHHSLSSTIKYFEQLKYKPKTLITIHKSNSGYFSNTEVTASLRMCADKFYIAKNNTKYILKE